MCVGKASVCEFARVRRLDRGEGWGVVCIRSLRVVCVSVRVWVGGGGSVWVGGGGSVRVRS